MVCGLELSPRTWTRISPLRPTTVTDTVYPCLVQVSSAVCAIVKATLADRSLRASSSALAGGTMAQAGPTIESRNNADMIVTPPFDNGELLSVAPGAYVIEGSHVSGKSGTRHTIRATPRGTQGGNDEKSWSPKRPWLCNPSRRRPVCRIDRLGRGAGRARLCRHHRRAGPHRGRPRCGQAS